MTPEILITTRTEYKHAGLSFSLLTNLPTNITMQNEHIAKGDSMSLFRPPIVRSAGAILDRALFSKTVSIAAARVHNNKNLAKFRKSLEKSEEILIQERIKNIIPDPDAGIAAKGGKCVLLKPQVKPGGMLLSALF